MADREGGETDEDSRSFWRATVGPKNFSEKYNRFTMENARQLQCKALRRLQKIRRRKNNGKQ
jgi:hypothetical protein